MRPTNEVSRPQPIEKKSQTRAESLHSVLVCEDAVSDLRRLGRTDRLRRQYQVTRREAVELVLVGLCEKVLALERTLELRDGFGTPLRKKVFRFDRAA